VIGITSKLASIHVTTKVSSSQVQPVGQKASALAADASRAATHMSSRRGGEGVAILLAAQHLGISGKVICKQTHNYVRSEVFKAMKIWTGLSRRAVLWWSQTFASAVPQHRRLVASFSPRSLQGSPCGICGVHCGTGIGFSQEFFGFSLSVSFRQCSVVTHVSSGGRTMGPPLAASVPHRQSHCVLTIIKINVSLCFGGRIWSQ
jgi:hypothetical protein